MPESVRRSFAPTRPGYALVQHALETHSRAVNENPVTNDQDRWMYCSNCGSTMNANTCPSCGRSLPANAHGKIDQSTGLMLAGWGRRVGGTFSDGIVMLLPALVIYSIFAEMDGYVAGALATEVALGA